MAVDDGSQHFRPIEMSYWGEASRQDCESVVLH